MADKLAPQDQDVEEARQLKDAVARLGASLREESERLKQDAAPDLPLPAAPRPQADPRIDTLLEQVAKDAQGRLEDTRRLAVIGIVVVVVAVVIAIAALLAAIAG